MSDIWDVMMVDPAIPVDRATLSLVIRDQRRPTRTYLYPWLRILSRVSVAVIVGVKRFLPFQFSAHATMDRLCVWFLRRFVDPEAVSLLIRHFIIETDLLNFAVRNAGVPGLRDVELRPTTLAGLGDNAVIEHDLNVYRVLLRIGAAHRDRAEPRDVSELDFSMLDAPATDPEWSTKRVLKLDIQSALCLMNIPFSFCLTSDEYRRAVHSMSLDTSLLTVLAQITGDQTFLSWGLNGVNPLRVESNIDVPRAVYEHAVLCEYAHARLRVLQRSSRPRLMA